MAWHDPRLEQLTTFGLFLGGTALGAALMVALDRRLNVWVSAAYGALFPTVFVALAALRGLVSTPTKSILLEWLFMSALFGGCAIAAAAITSALANGRLGVEQVSPTRILPSLVSPEKSLLRAVGKVADVVGSLKKMLDIFTRSQ